MIRLDPHRYDEFKEIYFSTAYDVICGLGKQYNSALKEYIFHVQNPSCRPARELVWFLNDYGLFPFLTGNDFVSLWRSCMEEGAEDNQLSSNGPTGGDDEIIEKMQDSCIREILRPLILGEVEKLRDAREWLKGPEESEASEESKEEKETAKPEGHSRELAAALKEAGLLYDVKEEELCSEGEGKNPIPYIPYSEEKQLLARLKKKFAPKPTLERQSERAGSGSSSGKSRKEEAEKQAASRSIYELLRRRWTFLDYLYTRGYENLRDKVPNCHDRRFNTQSISSSLVSLLELRSCPYCNRSYIGTTGKMNLGYQLDHYISKSLYPIFCMSLYNLVPSCNVCNGGKGDSDIVKAFSPFEECADYEGNLDFSYLPPLADEDGKGTVRVLVKDEYADSEKRYKATIDGFKLNECYSFNTPEADELIRKMIYYPLSMIRELGRVVSGESDAVEKKRTGEDEQTAENGQAGENLNNRIIGGEAGNRVLAERLVEVEIFREGLSEPEEDRYHPLSMMHRHLYKKFRE